MIPEIWDQTGRNLNAFAEAMGTDATLACGQILQGGERCWECVMIACAEWLGLRVTAAGSIIEGHISFHHLEPCAS